MFLALKDFTRWYLRMGKSAWCVASQIQIRGFYCSLGQHMVGWWFPRDARVTLISQNNTIPRFAFMFRNTYKKRMYLVHTSHPYYVNYFNHLKYGCVVVNKKFYRSVHNQCTRSKFNKKSSARVLYYFYSMWRLHDFLCVIDAPYFGCGENATAAAPAE